MPTVSFDPGYLPIGHQHIMGMKSRTLMIVWGHFFANGFDAESAAEAEQIEAKNAISAAVSAGVEHIVYSSLDDIEYVPHFKNKAEGGFFFSPPSLLSTVCMGGSNVLMQVSQWAREEGYPLTHLYIGFYLSNLAKFGFLEKQADGSLLVKISMPDDAPIPVYAVEQTGGWVLAAFKDKAYIGKCTSSWISQHFAA